MYNIGDLIYYKGNYGIVIGENEWYFFNESTGKHRVAKVLFEFVTKINIDSGDYRALRDSLLLDYKFYTENQIKLAGRNIKYYEPGAWIKQVGKNNVWFYVYLGFGQFHHEEYGIQMRDMTGYVYYRLGKEQQYFNLDTLKQVLIETSSIEMNRIRDNKFAMYNTRLLKVTSKLITNRVDIMGNFKGVDPFRLKVISARDCNIWESLIVE